MSTKDALPKLTIIFLKVYTWTMLLLLGLSAKVGAENIFKLYHKYNYDVSLLDGLESFYYTVILLLFCFVLFIFSLRYLLWVPWKIYKRIWSFEDDKKKKKIYEVDQYSGGLNSITFSDIGITLFYLVLEFFIIYFIFSSLDEPQNLIKLIFALPLIDILPFITVIILRTLIFLFYDSWHTENEIKETRWRIKLGQILNKDVSVYFLFADLWDLVLPALGIIVFHYTICTDIFSISHIWYHLELVSSFDILKLDSYLICFIGISSLIVAFRYRYSFVNIIMFLYNINRLEISEALRSVKPSHREEVPIEYLNHKVTFMNNEFFVDNRVYIPTVETENLVRYADKIIKQNSFIKVIDVGTGSGNISLTLATLNPNTVIIGADISRPALEVAKINKCLLQANNASFVHSNLLDKVDYTSTNMIVANLPWGSKKYLLKSNTPDKLRAMPDVAIFPESGLIGHYIKLIESIQKLKIQVTLIFESGVIPKNVLEEELDKKLTNPLLGKYIKFTDYSIYQIDFNK